jgi:hypothetical protein
VFLAGVVHATAPVLCVGELPLATPRRARPAHIVCRAAYNPPPAIGFVASLGSPHPVEAKIPWYFCSPRSTTSLTRPSRRAATARARRAHARTPVRPVDPPTVGLLSRDADGGVRQVHQPRRTGRQKSILEHRLPHRAPSAPGACAQAATPPRANSSLPPSRRRQPSAARSAPPSAPPRGRAQAGDPPPGSRARADGAGTRPCDIAGRGVGGSAVTAPAVPRNPHTGVRCPPAKRSPGAVPFKAERFFPQPTTLRVELIPQGGHPPPDGASPG